MASSAPKIENAPGLIWRELADGWSARWQARTDLVKRGFTPKSTYIWSGPESALTEQMMAYIQGRCVALQNEMLVWGRGGVPLMLPFDGTLLGLVRAYQNDEDSTYRKLRFFTRKTYDVFCNRLISEHGDERLADINLRLILRWYEGWAADGKVAMGHGVVGMLRTLVGFGATILEDEHCARLSMVLHRRQFAVPKPRSERLTAEQAIAVRRKAHEMGLHSIALAQAMQFDLMLRQKDVIGEWVPQSEPGTSHILHGRWKWLRGITWNEISDDLILKHVTSKRQKEIEVDLKLAPMVMEELAFHKRDGAAPLVICEMTQRPWNSDFRRHWRKIATLCGVPKSVRNMDTRAGAISEATDAGADLEHVRHAATHSNIGMTQRYSRGSAEKTAEVMQIRAAHRQKKNAS